MDQNQLEALIRDVIAEVLGSRTEAVPADLVQDVGRAVTGSAGCRG